MDASCVARCMSWGGEAGAPFTYDEIVRELTEAWTSMDDKVHLLWLLLLNGCDLHKLEVALMRAGDAHGPSRIFCVLEPILQTPSLAPPHPTAAPIAALTLRRHHC